MTEVRGDGRAFQDLVPHNDCWGCGPNNPHGLQIKSYWDGEDGVCTWQPSPWHRAGPPHVLNGGIIAVIFDCHSICTAIASHYRAEDRPLDSDPPIWCVTASLDITYRRPTPIDTPVSLRARIVEGPSRKTVVECVLESEGEE